MGTAMTPKVRWLALESDPELFTEYMRDIGIKGVECTDIFSFDEDCLGYIPNPCYGVILCMPVESKLSEYLKSVYGKLRSDEQEIPKNVFFMKQKISNACGTFALFHALANNRNRIDLGEGIFRKWLDKAVNLDVEQRSDSLAEFAELARAHEKCAKAGETRVQLSDKVEHHFICYVNVDDKLYEIDSSAPCPRLCCTTTMDNFLRDTAKVCRQFLTGQSENELFNAIALVQKL